MMKKSLSGSAILLLLLIASASGTAVTIHAGDDFYFKVDRLDSTRNTFSRYFNYGSFGLGLDNIGGSGVSFHTDLLGTNAFFDNITKSSSRKIIELSTGYLDWRSGQGVLGLRLGRQPYTDLVFDSYDLDGLLVSVRPSSKGTMHLACGMTVPSAWGLPELDPVSIPSAGVQDGIDDILAKGYKYKHSFFSNPARAGLLLLDGSLSVIPFTTLTAALGFTPAPGYMQPFFALDSVPFVTEYGVVRPDSLVPEVVEHPADDRHDFRAALGIDVSPVSFVRISGSGRFSSIEKRIDRYDGRLTVYPSKMVELSAYVSGEKGRIDSTNFFTIMLYDQISEFGLAFNAFPSNGVCIQGDYHSSFINNAGGDHFFSFDISSRYLSGGAGFSSGYHGMTIRPHAGVSLPFLKIFSLEGAGEFYRVWPLVRKDLITKSDTLGGPIPAGYAGLVKYGTTTRKIGFAPNNAVFLSGGIKMSIPVGLTIFPRIEYLINRYYAQDVRFLLTTNLLIRSYRGSGE